MHLELFKLVFGGKGDDVAVAVGQHIPQVEAVSPGVIAVPATNLMGHMNIWCIQRVDF